MAIHHTQVKKAEKLGVILAENDEKKLIQATVPRRGTVVFGGTPAEALENAQAFMEIDRIDDTVRIYDYHPDDPRMVRLVAGNGKLIEPGFMFLQPLVDAVNDWDGESGFDPNAEGVELEDTLPAPKNDVERSDKGVPLDGAIAFKEGVVAGDCPFDNESDDEDEVARAEAWYEAWDEAADGAPEEEKEGGSVVSQKYRARYAEAGHPTHCGDWLAETLNGICTNKGGINLELFEAICGLNGVDTSKYKRTGKGWEGRIRMTGRNLLAKVVFKNKGLTVMSGEETEFLKAPAEWIQQQRFKKEAKQ